MTAAVPAEGNQVVTPTTADTGVFGALRATPPSVRYLLGGVLINQLGAFAQTFLVLYLTVRGFSISAAGAALTAYSVGAVLGTLLGGALTDRIGPRTTITAAMTASAAILACIPILGDARLFWPLLGAVAVAGLVTQAYRPAAAVLLSDLMPAEYRVLAFSMMRIALNIGAALAPLLAAGLILIDWDLLFWIDAATAIGYAALALAMLPRTHAAPAEPDPTPDRRTTYATVLRDRKYLLFLASTLLGAAIYVQDTSVLPLKITTDGHSTGLYSAVLTLSSVILIACELKITTYVRRWPPYLAGLLGSALIGIGLATYAMATRESAAPIFVGTVISVAGLMICGPTMFAYPATFPAAVKARYIGAQQAVFGLGLALGPAVGVLAWEDLANTFWLVCGGLGVLAGLFALAAMKNRDDVG